MPKLEHTIRTMLLGRVACACGWYTVLGPEFTGRPRIARQDALLDAWLDHSSEMRKAGH